jgi:hypothetical protein
LRGKIIGNNAGADLYVMVRHMRTVLANASDIEAVAAFVVAKLRHHPIPET